MYTIILVVNFISKPFPSSSSYTIKLKKSNLLDRGSEREEKVQHHFVISRRGFLCFSKELFKGLGILALILATTFNLFAVIGVRTMHCGANPAQRTAYGLSTLFPVTSPKAHMGLQPVLLGTYPLGGDQNWPLLDVTSINNDESWGRMNTDVGLVAFITWKVSLGDVCLAEALLSYSGGI